jgi:hypothetical protein
MNHVTELPMQIFVSDIYAMKHRTGCCYIPNFVSLYTDRLTDKGQSL